MLVAALLATAAAAVSAAPVELGPKTTVLPLKYISNVTSIKSIVGRGHDRINKINGLQVSSASVTNEDVTYVAPVTIGGSTWQLIVDTGCMSRKDSLEGPC